MEVVAVFVVCASASPTSSAARSCSVVAAAELFAFVSVAELAPVVPTGALAAAATPVSEAVAALVWAVSEALGGRGAALAADAGGDAIYCESSAIAAAMALGSVLSLSAGVLVSSAVGFASADFAGAGVAALGSAFASAPDCASSCRKFGAPPPGACVAGDPPGVAGLAGAAVPFDPVALLGLLGPVAPLAPLPAELDRPPAPLDRAVPLDVAGVSGAPAALLDPGAAAPGLALPEPAPAFGAPPPSTLAMPPLEPRGEAAPVEAAGEVETDSRATPMYSVRWAAL